MLIKTFVTVKALLLSTLQQAETHLLDHFNSFFLPASRNLHATEKQIVITHSGGLNRNKTSDFFLECN